MRISPRNVVAALVIASAALFAGCGGGSSNTPPFTSGTAVPTPTPVPTNTPTPVPTNTPTPTPTNTPTPSPTPTPVPAPIGATGTTVSLTAAGKTAQFQVTESGYSGTFTLSNGSPSCSGIATVSPSSGTGPSTLFTVTAVAAGACVVVVSDDHGGSVSVQITVTTTTGTISGVRRRTN
jgi:chitinase